jgi:AraC-like DNA-binding protein
MGRDALQRPGDVVLYDTARPFTYALPKPYGLIVLKIPRTAILARLPDAERLTCMVIDGRKPLGDLAGNMIRSAARLDTMDMAGGARVAASILDVLSAALHVEVGSRLAASDRHLSLYRRARDFIGAHLDDPSLDLASLAKALHVSESTLGRLFAANGTTVMRHVWQQRLEASHRALSEGSSSTVTEVALRYGFTSFSHFSRAFKQVYGVPPGKLIIASPTRESLLHA